MNEYDVTLDLFSIATWYSQQPSQERPATTSSYWRRSTESHGLGWRMMTSPMCIHIICVYIYILYICVNIYIYIFFAYCTVYWYGCLLKLDDPKENLNIVFFARKRMEFLGPKTWDAPMWWSKSPSTKNAMLKVCQVVFWRGKPLLDSQFPSDCCITSALSGIMTFPCHTTLHTLRICLHIRHGDGKCGTNSPVAKGQVVSRRRFLGRLMAVRTGKPSWCYNLVGERFR